MKRTHFITLFLTCIIILWFASSINNVQKAKNRQGVIFSPDKSKSIEVINGIGTTQVMMNFHKYLLVSGSNVVSGQFETEMVQLTWIDDNNVNIKIPLNSTFMSKEKEIKFFSEIVKVKYIEYN